MSDKTKYSSTKAACDAEMTVYEIVPGIQLVCRATDTGQADLAGQIAAYLVTHLDQHITIPELARRFHISGSHLKNTFKAVYGMPVYSYLRICRMQTAAWLLIHTDLSVAEVGYQLGYSNTSKFSAAFRAVQGEAPGQYRKTYRTGRQ